jgi:hypothetical protein
VDDLHGLSVAEDFKRFLPRFRFMVFHDSLLPRL